MSNKYFLAKKRENFPTSLPIYCLKLFFEIKERMKKRDLKIPFFKKFDLSLLYFKKNNLFKTNFPIYKDYR